LVPEGFDIILFLAPAFTMPIRMFVEARPTPYLPDLTFDHCSNIMTQKQATAGAIIIYQITDTNRISLHLLLQLLDM
jgi:hypothetical protein